MQQVRNPLQFRCAPNQATPDYVVYDDLRMFVAYGLMCCWLGDSEDDPNSDTPGGPPWTRSHVKELRGYFLELVETVIAGLWQKRYEPGDGALDSNCQYCCLDDSDDVVIAMVWCADLRAVGMLFQLQAVGFEQEFWPVGIWLSYDSIADRQNVINVLQDAWATLDDTVGNALLAASREPSVTGVVVTEDDGDCE